MTDLTARLDLASSARPVAGERRLKRALRGSALRSASAILVAVLMGGMPGAVFAQNDALPAQPNAREAQPDSEAAKPANPNVAGEQQDTPPTFIGTTAEDEGVMTRLRPEYDAKGIPLGGFRLFPVVTLGANFDDNVRRISSKAGDWYFEQAPAMRLQSQWGRHFVEIYGGIDNYNYARFDSLSLTDWNIGADGRYDIARGVYLSGLGSYGEYHEGLDSPNTVGGQASPTRFFKTHGEVTGLYQPDRIGLAVGASIDRFLWGFTPLIGLPSVVNADRNETEYQAYVKGIYEFSENYSGFVKALIDSRGFDQFFDRNGLHRASSGFRLDGGVDLQLSHLVTGEVYIGYLEQHYAQDVPQPLSNVAGLDFGAKLDWFATPLLTVHLSGSRTVNDITIYLASATDDKTVRVSADYELLRNVILQGYVSYVDSKLIGTGRNDQYTAAGIKARYLMNSHMSADLGFNFSDRSSNSAFVSFNDSTVTLALNLHV